MIQVVSKKGRPQGTQDDARAALIAAAKQKFVNKPYDKVSIRELAELAGVIAYNDTKKFISLVRE